MNAWPKCVGAITLERSKSCYQNAFGLPEMYEDENSAVICYADTLINRLKPPAARPLIEPGVVASGVAGWRFHL